MFGVDRGHSVPAWLIFDRTCADIRCHRSSNIQQYSWCRAGLLWGLLCKHQWLLDVLCLRQWESGVWGHACRTQNAGRWLRWQRSSGKGTDRERTVFLIPRRGGKCAFVYVGPISFLDGADKPKGNSKVISILVLVAMSVVERLTGPSENSCSGCPCLGSCSGEASRVLKWCPPPTAAPRL